MPVVESWHCWDRTLRVCVPDITGNDTPLLDAFEDLIRSLPHDDQAPKILAEYMMDSPRAKKILAELVRHPDPEIRQLAANAKC